MNNYEKIASGVVVNRIRSSWIELFKFYNDQASKEGGTLSMAFVLLTINEKYGTPVTKIAPRMNMEPNSLSRLLKSLEEKGFISKRKDLSDKRKVYICLTKSGLKLRDKASEKLFALEKIIKSKISNTELTSFFNVLDYISEILESEKKISYKL
ncbi:MAG: MarR family transcriptional regulator [Crocinitomicaceae bacterium]|jgi:DNA-binding MarR family transcriptional regulator|nr:MarR family transcriptional regulator [Crocinitomicaceae bacterium]|tara:strand:- start:672 stop:1133 length:462 start_codon:yes stop_codon:yes gene_type:complete